ncbi:MAG: hypothetical protein IPM99_24170 [Rubrivivax sp.]|nr:hypothetical protein [Rubrivivax sp.]
MAIAAHAGGGHDGVTRAPDRHASANRHHGAGEYRAQHRPPRPPPAESQPAQQPEAARQALAADARVATVHRGGLHPHQQLARAVARQGLRHQRQHLGPAIAAAMPGLRVRRRRDGVTA